MIGLHKQRGPEGQGSALEKPGVEGAVKYGSAIWLSCFKTKQTRSAETVGTGAVSVTQVSDTPLSDSHALSRPLRPIPSRSDVKRDTHPTFASTTHSIFILKTLGVNPHIVLDGVYLIQ
jgi:hypothetical protein